MTLRVFPVADVSGVHYSDDWATPRANGRSHQGNDLFAPDGTAVLAPDDGQVRFTTDPIGGLSFYLKAGDGTTYYGTHLSAVEGTARAVSAGEIIAYVGHGGNAAGTPSHLHFEVHPGGGAAIDPFPLLQSAERRTAPSASSSSLSWLVILGLAGGIGYLAYRQYGFGQGLVRDVQRRLA